MNRHAANPKDVESTYAWMRLAVSLLLMTIGGSGMYSVTVVLPRIQGGALSGWRGKVELGIALREAGFGA